MFRLDPLTKKENLDIEFYACKNFFPERRALMKYLKEEGFGKVHDTFIICFRSRKWLVKWLNEKGM